jgi:tetratricopeptide (TPR) repeat protein
MHRLLTTAFVALIAAAAFAHDGRHGGELFQPGLDEAEAQGPSVGAPPSLPERPAASRLAITASSEAQAWFDHGLDLVWGFNHAEAVRFFRAGQEADPGCAMCFWGEALALGPNINDAMADAAVRPVWEAVKRAVALGVGASPKEQALIAALARRYGAEPTADRAALDEAWAGAIGNLAARWPDDPEILVLQADALMNLQPWDYWEDGGVTPKEHGGEIVAVLERALALAPDHPAALHLYIHAVEASAGPGRAEAAADRLNAVEGATGHLLHMPAHIYTRVGRHADSIEANRKAIAADKAFLAATGEAASPLYPVRQTLGAVLLAAGRPEEAAEAFRAALAQMPRNGWALWGLAEAERAAGADLAATEDLLEKAWLGDRGLLTLDRL